MSEDEWIEQDEELPVTEVWGELGFELVGLEGVKLAYASPFSRFFFLLFGIGFSVSVLGGVLAHATGAQIVEPWVFIAIAACSAPFAFLSQTRGHQLFDPERRELVLQQTLLWFRRRRTVLPFAEIAGFAVETTRTRDSTEGAVYYAHRPVLVTKGGRVILLGQAVGNLRLLNRSLQELATILKVEAWPGSSEATLEVSGSAGDLRVAYR